MIRLSCLSELLVDLVITVILRELDVTSKALDLVDVQGHCVVVGHQPRGLMCSLKSTDFQRILQVVCIE